MNIYLRPLRVEDAAISWKWRNDKEVWTYTGNQPPAGVTIESETAWLEEALKRTNEKRFAICLEQTHEYIGNAQFTDITEHGAQLHIFIGEKQYWGKGFGTTATAELLKLADESLSLELVYLQVHPDNEPAIRIYEKLGFRTIGNINSRQCLMERRLRRKAPLVSVFMMSHNHEAYIAESVNGVLAQQCQFSIEMVIGDDGSRDNSRSILFDLYKRAPEKFRLLLHPKNIGAIANQMAVLDLCDGTYMAMCECDDYWTEPTKLQKQITWLGAHPDYSACFHDALQLDQQTGATRLFRQVDGIDFSTEDLILQEWFIPTHSVVYRRSALRITPWLWQVPNGDYAMLLLASLHGKLHRFPEIWGVYRYHTKGSNQQFDDPRFFIAQILKLLSFFNQESGFRYATLIDRQFLYWLNKLGRHEIIHSFTEDRPFLIKIFCLDFWLRKTEQLPLRKKTG